MFSILNFGTVALAGLKGYCEPCDPETDINGIAWTSTDETKNYESDDRSTLRNDDYETWVKRSCGAGFTGVAWRYCTGNGEWFPTVTEATPNDPSCANTNCDGCTSDPCTAGISETEYGWDANKLDFAAMKAGCTPNTAGGAYCDVFCQDGLTPNNDKLRCWGGKWATEYLSCVGGKEYPQQSIPTDNLSEDEIKILQGMAGQQDWINHVVDWQELKKKAAKYQAQLDKELHGDKERSALTFSLIAVGCILIGLAFMYWKKQKESRTPEFIEGQSSVLSSGSQRGSKKNQNSSSGISKRSGAQE
jgi:hypothetical protein